MSLTRFVLRLALGTRLPITSGELRLHGPQAPVTIRRDQWGVPHVDATSEGDWYFAFGFCQGHDRAGQLEVLWRLVRGRLAEWVGPVALVADRMSRRIGFRRAAEAQLAVLAPEVRAAFESFVNGMNAGTTHGLPSKPHEFAILGGTPSTWDAADVLGLLKLQSFLLPANWDVELARLRILLEDGADALVALDPLVVTKEQTAPPSRTGGLEALATHLTADLAALQAYLPRGGGSNNWAVSGSRTESGKPLLASDPHLAPNCPPPWYLAHLRTPQWETAGAALAGTPGIAIGHNGFAAWGVTAGLTDNTDFFLETLGPDGQSVRRPDGGFEPCEVRTEIMRVKGQPDAVEEVVITPRGPILTPLLPNQPFALSLAAIWLEPRPVVGFFGAPAARSFDEFRRHFAAWPVLPLNVMYADTEGTIGWQLVGEVPIRRGGRGILPRPADLRDSGWAGAVPFDAMPFVKNPECGYLATANDPPDWATGPTPLPAGRGEKSIEGSDSFVSSQSVSCSPSQQGGGWGAGLENAERGARKADSSESRPWLGCDFIDDYRARRIRERLAERDSGWTLADLAAIQLDVQSIPWREMRASVLSLVPENADARAALNLLGPWDGRMDTESPAAAVFELFLAEMCVRVAKAKAPNGWRSAVGEGAIGILGHNLFADRRVAHLSRLIREQPPGWFESWSEEMESTLAAVVRKLHREAGPGPAFWAWGHLRMLRLDHPLFGRHRWLGPAFNRGPIPWGGDANTVSQAAIRPADPTGFVPNMANLRTAFDLSDLQKSTFVLCGGQSGNPLSPHHADQLPLWQRGESFVMPWEQAAVIRAAVDTLRLLPASGA